MPPETTDTMNAIGFQRYGPPSVLEPLRLPKPHPGANQILVRVIAAGLNPADANIRAGRFKQIMRQPFPIVPGSDIAGLVERVGSDVTRFKPGDAVYGLLPLLKGGGYGEYALAGLEEIALKPASFDFVRAASVPLAALTALQAFEEQGGLRPGQRVLINGASGGVGTFAVQIAKRLGARVSTLTSARNQAFVQQLGADETFDYANLSPSALESQFDLVFDCAATLSFGRAGRWLRRGGAFVSLIPVPNPLSIAQAAITGKRYRWLLVKANRSQLERVAAWLDEGKISPSIERVFAPTEMIEAHELLESKRVRGKLVMARSGVSSAL